MLRIKQENNYRRGGKDRNCGLCHHYMKEFQVIGIGGDDLGREPRCRIIGLRMGRQYRISEKNRCDSFVQMPQLVTRRDEDAAA